MQPRHRSNYRFVIEGPVSARFTAAFPDLVETGESAEHTVLEGPVADPSQLAGIVSDFCYRNTRIVRLEVVDGDDATMKP